MKNHIFLGLSYALILTLFTFTTVACSTMDDDIEEGSITLSFPSFARNSVLSSDDENYYLSVNIRGDYTDKELVKITSEVSNCQVVFEKIPIGKSIYLTANLYTAYSEAAYLHVFTGKSSNFVVAGGRNQVSIQMTDLTRNDGGGIQHPYRFCI